MSGLTGLAVRASMIKVIVSEISVSVIWSGLGLV